MPLYVIPSNGGDRNLIVCIPKPPKIGSAYAPAPRFDRPYKHSHNPDQDWMQSVLLHGSLPRRGVLGIVEDMLGASHE